MHRITAVLLSFALVASVPAATASVPDGRQAPRSTPTLDDVLGAVEATGAAQPQVLDAAWTLSERGNRLAEADTASGALDGVLGGSVPTDHPLFAAARLDPSDDASALERSRALAPTLSGAAVPASTLDEAPANRSTETAPGLGIDGVPDPVARILAAYLELEAAVPEPPLTTDEVDQLAEARDDALATILATLPELRTVEAKLQHIECGLFAIDLVGTPQTYDCPLPVIVDVGGDDKYFNEAGGAEGEAAVLVDLAGDDLYAPADDAGDAVVGAAQAGAALLVDAAGDDVYTVQRDAAVTATGSAVAGAATLYDGGGRDRYDGTVDNLDGSPALMHGSSLGGSSRLVDVDGRDRYHANATGIAAANGAALDGVARLVDEGGDDRYNATVNRSGAANGASSNMTAAVHAFPDLLQETVTLTGVKLEAGDRTDVELELGLRGDALLHDRAGDDTYAAQLDRGVAQGAATLGAGILVDGGGDDDYEAWVGEHGAANGAGYVGLGVLADTEGDDTYEARVPAGALHGGGHLGVGALVDGGGNDDYVSQLEYRGGAHGGALFGMGLLADAGGTNTHRASGPALGGSLGGAHGLPLPTALPGDLPEEHLELQLGVPGSLGILLAGPGEDIYDSDHVTQGAGELYAQGILLDRGGPNTYEAGDGSLAQGAARSGGIGVLVDRGNPTSFALGPGGQGQGVGVQGAGILLRAPPDPGDAPPPTTSYEHPSPGQVRTTGGGVGLLLDPSQVEGLAAPTGCDTDPLTDPFSVGGVAVFACEPKPRAQVPILDPVTGEPIGGDPSDPSERSDRVEKRPLCGSLPTATETCVETLREATSDEAVEWFERDHVHTRTDGALEVGLAGVPADDGSGGDDPPAWALLEEATVDGTCEPYCWAFGEV